MIVRVVLLLYLSRQHLLARDRLRSTLSLHLVPPLPHSASSSEALRAHTDIHTLRQMLLVLILNTIKC